MCVYNTYKGRGCWTGSGHWGTRGLAGWLAEGGAGAGPGWPIENALKAATFQKQKNSRKKTEKKHKKKQKLAQEKKENVSVCLCFFCGMNCVFFLCFLWYELFFFVFLWYDCFFVCVFFVVWIVFFFFLFFVV